MAKNKRRNITLRKKAMIDALEKSLGVVTTACKNVGLARNQHYLWLKEDPEYAEAVRDLDDLVLDFAESQLHKQIKDGNHTSTIFFLKTRGKRRGYTEGESHVHYHVPPAEMPSKEREDRKKELREKFDA
jgi:hypothetical protein